MVIDMQVPMNIVTAGGGKYEGLVNLGTPPQQFEFSVDNGVLAFTMVADAQPIICDGFSTARRLQATSCPCVSTTSVHTGAELTFTLAGQTITYPAGAVYQ